TRILAAAGTPCIPVCAGSPASLTHRLAERDGAALYLSGRPLDSQEPAEAEAIQGEHGVDLIRRLCADGETAVITIGAMTNLAVALTMEPMLRRTIPRVISMAGAFGLGTAEWNIRCDPVAATVVLSSGAPVDMVPFDVTQNVVLSLQETSSLSSSQWALQRVLGGLIEVWRVAHPEWSNGGRPTLHDPLAVIAAFQPDLFRWETGRISVELAGDLTYGYTTFTPDAAGPHRVARSVDRKSAVDLFLERVTSYGG
ncbi:MAG TPA: nucleoside hydrolase, partial [Chthonomonadales bacterium]|nr:nucleoside hydrolase [Chthonomonadales bacterium]